MPRGNPDNLRSIAELTTEEKKEFTRKGGQASGEARRKKRDMRELARVMLDAPLLDTDMAAAELKARGFDSTGAGAVLLAQLQKAQNGDTKAAEFVRDTSGQKPADSLAIGNLDDKPFETLELNGLTDEQLKELVSKRQEAEVE